MADYYSLLARAVGALPQSTPETRNAIYERARKALIGQLRRLDPPAPEVDLAREVAALDEAIARLEVECAILGAPTPVAPSSPSPPSPMQATPAVSQRVDAKLPQLPEAARKPESEEVSDRGEILRSAAHSLAVNPPKSLKLKENKPATSDNTLAEKTPPGVSFAKDPHESADRATGQLPPHKPKSLVIALTIAGVVVVGAIAIAAYFLPNHPFDQAKESGATTDTVRNTDSSANKINGRAQAGQNGDPSTATGSNETVLGIAQQAQFLILINNETKEVREIKGEALWHYASIPSEDGGAPATSVICEANFPEAHMTATVQLQPNRDPSFSAAYVIRLNIALTEGAPLTGFQQLLFPPELFFEGSTSAVRLNAGTATITDKSFLIALPQSEPSNEDILKSRDWIDFPLVTNDGKYSKIFILKGTDGARIINQAFKDWNSAKPSP